jgi:hypothetical protein
MKKTVTQTCINMPLLCTQERSSRKRKAASGECGAKGAIIESMHHHGKGVYSGTFSGTLNPALQDSNGQPKRDITTIVHILNDLLCAQYKAYSSSSSSTRSSHHHRHHQRGEAGARAESKAGRLRGLSVSFYFLAAILGSVAEQP